MAAEENQVLFPSQFFRQALVEYPALRRRVDHPRRPAFLALSGMVIGCQMPFCNLFRDSLPGRIYGLCLHEHTRSAAIGIIVRFSMFIHSVISDIHRFQADVSFLHSPPQNTGVKALHHHLWKER